MLQFIVRRVLQTIPVVIGITLLTFGLLRLTGDPAAVLLPLDAPEEARIQFRAEHGLDRPVIVQYGLFVSRAVQGDFGRSLRYHEPVIQLYMGRFMATFQLVVVALTLGVLIGVILGVIAATRRSGPLDSLTMGIAVAGQSVPGFYLGILLIITFSVVFRILPSHGSGTLFHLIMPAVTLALYPIALLARFSRSCLLEVLSRDYIRTARAKGLSSRTVIYKHALKNSLIPIITVIALQLGSLFSTAVAVESVFAWPGAGRLTLEAVFTRDFPVVQVSVIITALVFVGANLVGDLMYGVVDPRVRFE